MQPCTQASPHYFFFCSLVVFSMICRSERLAKNGEGLGTHEACLLTTSIRSICPPCVLCSVTPRNSQSAPLPPLRPLHVHQTSFTRQVFSGLPRFKPLFSCLILYSTQTKEQKRGRAGNTQHFMSSLEGFPNKLLKCFTAQMLHV